MVRAWLIALLLTVVAVVATWPGTASAAPSPRQRVVLADPDPELRRAMELALAPYRFEVVIEGAAPSDAALAQERADADTARFVVWRDGAQLVVYDRELGTTERRDSQAGVLDPPAAAAAALTIKTMMRLPPPPPPEQPALPPPPPAEEPGLALRFQAGLATRIEHTDATTAGERFGGTVTVRPFGWLELRLGVAVDGGSGTSVDRASFKGTFSDWSVLGVLGWTFTRGHLEVEPHAGFGVRLATLDGAEQSTPRTEHATLTALRGGAWARLRYARFAVGVSLAVDDVFGTPTYTKTGTPAVVFQVPGGGVELGGVISVDL